MMIFFPPEILSNQDQQICTYLEEKLHIYAELGELSGFEDFHLEPHLLIKPDPGEPPQAASLLAAALKEGKLLWEWFGLTDSKHVYLRVTHVGLGAEGATGWNRILILMEPMLQKCQSIKKYVCQIMECYDEKLAE